MHADDTARRGSGAEVTRVVARGAVVLAAAWLAWTAITAQLAARAVQAGRPAAALLLDSASTVAAAASAERALLAAMPDRALDAAIAAVTRAPYTVQAVRTIGLIDAGRGADAAAGFWMGLAGGLGWRDIPTQLWIADRLIAGGRYADALPRLEALVRQQNGAPSTLRPLNALADIPRARAVLVARLAQRPPWRGAFLIGIGALAPEDVAGRDALVAELSATPAPVTRAELQPDVARRAGSGDVVQARALWLGFAADRRRLAGSGLYDGGFDAASGDVSFPFEWSIPDMAAALVTIAPDETGNPALVVRASGDLPPLLMTQQLLLAAGTYLVGAGTERGAGADQIHWEMRCVSGAPLPLMPERGGSGALRFTVPATGCPTQRLELHGSPLGDGTPVDLRIDDVALRRADTG